MTGPGGASIVVAGVSHHRAPLDVRERLALPASEVVPFLEEVRERAHAAEAVAISTCNRTELYLVETPQHVAPPVVWDALSRRLGEEAAPYGYVHRDRDAVAHLFRVASGLDSMILGEAQIHGQVRTSWETSRATSGTVLNRLFQASLQVAGRVRSETALGHGAASVSSAAVQLAKQIFGSLKGRRAMILGAGEMAELALECLTSEGVRASIVANRTIARARELAGRYGAQAMGYDTAWPLVAEVDVLLSSTAAPVPVVTPELLRPGLAARGDRPLCVLDIAMPRDVHPAVRQLDNVFLYDLDDLQSVVAANLERRRSEVPTAEQLIAAETTRFADWFAGLDVVPVLTRFRARAEEIRERELADALRRLGDLTPEQRAQVEHLSRALTNKFLHEPTVRLRAAAAEGRGVDAVDALRHLFDLEDAASPTPAAASAGARAPFRN